MAGALARFRTQRGCRDAAADLSCGCRDLRWPLQGGPARPRAHAIADFLESSGQTGEKGFYECEVQRSIQAYDCFAVAYSVVESRRDRSAARADFVGVNSVQLYKDGAQWKILSLYYHVEKPGMPIPPGGGQSGKCIE